MLGSISTGIQSVQVSNNAFSLEREVPPIDASIHVVPRHRLAPSQKSKLAFITSSKLDQIEPCSRLGFLHIITHNDDLAKNTSAVPLEDFHEDQIFQFRSLVISSIYNFLSLPQIGRHFQSVNVKFVQTDCPKFEKFMIDILNSKNLKNLRIQKSNITDKIKLKLLKVITNPEMVVIRLDGVTCGNKFRQLQKRNVSDNLPLIISSSTIMKLIEEWMKAEYPELKKIECLVSKPIVPSQELRNPHTGQVGEVTHSLYGISDYYGHKFSFVVKSGENRVEL
ncbi:hypothetical protein L596_026018 [Steinernema carpocapsae]|uniref:Uncharacterized protein n=1 Tax=Steinernema carpocapsae TaxID=34508 RepID=A0A4V5ZY27_STECR|nr:hypothetical protein L596_026018 [Steinernema carpocapsae]